MNSDKIIIETNEWKNHVQLFNSHCVLLTNILFTRYTLYTLYTLYPSTAICVILTNTKEWKNHKLHSNSYLFHYL